MIDRGPNPFTPAELAGLRVLRYRALADAGDNAPMERVTYTGSWSGPRETIRRVIPWIDALNMEVD